MILPRLAQHPPSRLRSLVGIAALAAFAFAVAPCVATAQPPSAPAAPLVPMYGVGDDEFLIGAYLATRPHGPIAGCWDFARSLGISMLQPGFPIELTDSLIDAPQRAAMNGRLIIRGLTPLQDAGMGRAISFFPFDSTESPVYQWKFTQLDGGRVTRNAEEGGALERVYAADSATSAGMRVAGGIAYDWRPWQVRRFPARPYDTTAHDASALVDWYMYRMQFNHNAPTFHVVVTGHLFEGGAAPPADTLLLVDLIYEVPAGRSYVDTAGARHTVSGDAEMPYATVAIRKEELLPRPGEAWGRYRTAVHAVDLMRSPGSAATGPINPANESRRLDVRVRWTGRERLALRSVSLRDSIGELVLGEEPASRAYQAAIVGAARRVLYGPNPFGPLRRSVIRLMTGIEQQATEFAPAVAIESLLRAGLTRGFDRGEMVPLHTEGATAEKGLASFHATVPGDAVFTEVLLAPALDTSARYGSDLYRAYQDRMKLTVTQVPSIAAHNGGRFQIPLLVPTAAAVETEYEPVIQILRMGEYEPAGAKWPWSLGNVTRLGEGAEISRSTGRRMIVTVFTTCELHLRQKTAADPLDTLMSHPPEAAELRTLVNLGLAYGARGIHYYWFGNYINHMHRSEVDPNQWVGVNDSWGSNGPFTDDTTLDHADPFALTDDVPTALYPAGTPRVLLPDFWVGYGVRTREVRRINRWLAAIGPELTRLRWRDGYSIHATVPHPSLDPAQIPVRPIAPGEIVRGIEVRSRSGAPDPPHLTYVEIGLFDPLHATGDTAAAHDSLRDIHHVFVVNRRSFERPDDVDAGTPLGRTLDSLAESRSIGVRFALTRPGDWRSSIIRVRELAPDTTRLPLMATARQPLDTFIHADSTAIVRLRPGGGALLEITYPLAIPRSDTGRSSMLRLREGRKREMVMMMMPDVPAAMMRASATCAIDPRRREPRTYSFGVSTTSPPTSS